MIGSVVDVPITPLPAAFKADELYGQLLTSPFNPFADTREAEKKADSGGGGGAKEVYVHIRLQQRKGKKCLTTVEGLRKDLDFKKKLKDLKKGFCCNGNVVEDKELGMIIQLQGDQRNVQQFLVQGNIVHKDNIKIHGF